MKERPIIFSAQMVMAILDGRKTQTRRVVKLPKGYSCQGEGYVNHGGTKYVIDCPYGQPGDHLWVRERITYVRDDPVNNGQIHAYCYTADIPADKSSANPYTAPYFFADDGVPSLPQRNIPSIHMPRWASRIDLEITGIRVERLQDISKEDAIAEGVSYSSRYKGYHTEECRHFHASDSRESYAHLWESINGPGSWDSNPWVWVVEFKRIRP